MMKGEDDTTEVKTAEGGANCGPEGPPEILKEILIGPTLSILNTVNE